MKSEWEFRFETRDFHFEKEHKFLGSTKEQVALGARPPEAIEFQVRIVPSNDKPPPFVDQVGSLFITMPCSQEDTKSFAHYVAAMMADRITFQSGDFRIHYGLVFCKRIAETPDEEQEFGDKLYSAEVHLEEVIPTMPFDSIAFAQLPSASIHPGLISQFNDTKRDNSPIRQFLGYFRILESAYHLEPKKQTLKQALCGSAELRAIYASLVEGGDLDALANALVDIRHRCAHLRLGTGFGYVPTDPAIEGEVRPHVPLLAAMAYRCIVQKAV
jgi:hypothetical protein